MNRELSTQVNNMNRQLPTFDSAENYIFDRELSDYAHPKLLRYVTDEYIRDVKAKRKTIDGFLTALNKLNDREAKSLLYIKNSLENNSWKNLDFDSHDCRNLLITYLQEHPDPLNEYNHLIRCKIQNHLPDMYLGWFEKDLRCSLFLANMISDSLQGYTFKGKHELIAEVYNFFKYYIYIFNDVHYQNLPFYKWSNEEREGDWRVVYINNTKSVYLKNRTKEKDMKWIDSSDSEQIEWAYNYLARDNRSHIMLEDMFFPETISEKYELIISSLDIISNVETSVDSVAKTQKRFSPRGKVLHDMKRAWDGRKGYAKNSLPNDDISVKVYKKNLEKLSVLLEADKTTHNQLVNRLIEEAYEANLVEESNSKLVEKGPSEQARAFEVSTDSELVNTVTEDSILTKYDEPDNIDTDTEELIKPFDKKCHSLVTTYLFKRKTYIRIC